MIGNVSADGLSGPSDYKKCKHRGMLEDFFAFDSRIYSSSIRLTDGRE